MAYIPFFANPLSGQEGGFGNPMIRQLSAQPGSDPIEQNRRLMYEGAEGRLSQLRDDPVDAEIMQALRGRTGAGAGPYDEATRNAMFTDRSAQAAGAQSTGVQRLLRSGMNPGDPGFQAALAELESSRQGSLQNARMQIDANANVANYGARGQAIGQLTAMNAGRNQAITNQSNYVSNLRGNEVITENLPRSSGSTGGGAYPLPNFAQYNAQQAPAAQPAATRAPASAPAPGPRYSPPTQRYVSAPMTDAERRQTNYTSPDQARIADFRRGVGQYSTQPRSY